MSLFEVCTSSWAWPSQALAQPLRPRSPLLLWVTLPALALVGSPLDADPPREVALAYQHVQVD